MLKWVWGGGFAPHSPDPLAGFKGATSRWGRGQGGERRRDGEGRKNEKIGKEKGKGGKKRKGRGDFAPCNNFWVRQRLYSKELPNDSTPLQKL